MSTDDDFDTVDNPNDVYVFFEKRACKLCGGQLVVEDRAMHFDVDPAEYITGAKCSSSTGHTYEIDIKWADPKFIPIDEEVFEFDYGANDYALWIYYIESPITVVSINSGAEIEFQSATLIPDQVFTPETLANKIETCLLLK